MFGFQLGREFKLCIAELLSVFPEGKIVFFDKKFLILEGISKDKILTKADELGGTIKICEISKDNNFKDFILNKDLKKNSKFIYGISVFGDKSNLKELLIGSKKTLKQKDISSRFINKNSENLSSSQIFLEKLVERYSDFTVLNHKEKIYIGTTIWVQDINKYSKRDYEKSRDMKTGMLPPKLAQIMINVLRSESGELRTEKKEMTKDLSSSKKLNSQLQVHSSIYDPFVGLGTILIEASLMGYKKLYGSDINEKMISSSISNLERLKKDLGSFDFDIFHFDVRDLGELRAENGELSDLMNMGELSIVTEGFLGEIMTKKNICEERINIQRKNLSKMYKKFFSGLQKIKFSGDIVICFPFWELDKKYIYFLEVYKIIDEFCLVQKLFPKDCQLKETKAGSLLYKRDNQLVGREIFRLKINLNSN